MNDGKSPKTKLEAYQEILEEGTDASLRKRVAAALSEQPMTTHELTQEFEESANAIRPRVNELLRMYCIKRTYTRKNPSGHEAYVYEITSRGLDYLDGAIDPDPGKLDEEVSDE